MKETAAIPGEFTEVWQECLTIMENKLGKPTFETCLKNSQPISLTKDTLNIGVTSKFAKDWLVNRYSNVISDTLHSLSGKRFSLQFAVCEPKDLHKKHQDFENKELQKEEKMDSTLNPKYTFDSFVVGNGNHLAAAAAIAVAEAPAKAYNPLFIYGGVGLGKTHLMHAIGHTALSHNRKAKVVYVSTERFTNELIGSIEDRQTVQFRKKYRSVDILLVDDIQFLVNKERTQEEFFHTFNELHSASKQIVITSDRPPKDIPTLEERLRSRFEWGLIADIQTPDLETREAILRKKAESEKVNVPLEVITFIAEKVPSNIRELEGALLRVIAFSSLNKVSITLDLAIEALKLLIEEEKNKPLTVKIIQHKVADYFGIKMDDLTGERRDQKFSYPRQIAMYLARELTNASFPDIGKEFGGKDHSTVMHACRKISESSNDPSLKGTIDNLLNILKEK